VKIAIFLFFFGCTRSEGNNESLGFAEEGSVSCCVCFVVLACTVVHCVRIPLLVAVLLRAAGHVVLKYN